MNRVKILVEGQTEESFVSKLLYGHLAQRGIFITPILLTTKRVKNRDARERSMPGRRFKGGVTTYGKVKLDVRKALKDREAIVTTMIDFYGLPNDFPGMGSLPTGSGYERARYLEQAFEDDIDVHRFQPFLALHEYEALLFSQPKTIAAAFPEQAVAEPLQGIRDAFASPEEINQGRETHPSARIMAHVTGYRKPFHGTLIAERIGLTQIRRECAHFAEWVAWLESLGD
ncbi:MAG: DUF4276 family protein [Chloroflexi bacterium]|nr:DUF4276 family protein [Chloroflexota bacterium]